MGSGCSEEELSCVIKLSAYKCYRDLAVAESVPPVELTAASLPQVLFAVCLPNPAAPWALLTWGGHC